MKITIYVNYEHLERLYNFISGQKLYYIEWYHDRPSFGRYFMVSIDYNDFVNLDNK